MVDVAAISDRFDGAAARIVVAAPKAAAAAFDILDPASADRAKAVQAQMLAIAARRTTNPRPVSFKTADTMRRRMLPLPHFVLQYGLDAWGLPQSGVVELIGWPSCGKTSLTFTLGAHIMLTRATRFSSLKRWALDVAQRRGMKRAKVALARKLGVVLHRMWMDATEFRWSKAAAVAA